MSNDDSGIRLTRRRVLGGVAATGAATAGLGAGSYALFSDTESSTGNTVVAGTLDLEVTENGFSEFQGNLPTNMRPGDIVDFQIKLKNVGTVQADYITFDFDYSVSESANGSDEADTDPNTGTDSAKGDMGKLIEVFRLNYDADGNNNFIRKDSDLPDGPLDDIELASNDPDQRYKNNNIVDLYDLKEHSGPPDNGEPVVGRRLSPAPAPNGASGYVLEGSFVFVDPTNQRWPGYRQDYDPTYMGDQKSNWYQGDQLNFVVGVQLSQ